MFSLSTNGMKPLSYYQTTSVSIPNQDDYMTIYYYRKGVMVGMKRQFDEDFQPPKRCVEEKVLDELSYNAHLNHYYEEQEKLKNEFREDLIAEYHMTNHPKANKIFDKAWELGHSKGYEEVEYYFQDLTELFDKDVDYTTHITKERRKIDRRQSNKTGLNYNFKV
jgi:flagellar biosynthesis/type III secretory pathway protein FliH